MVDGVERAGRREGVALEGVDEAAAAESDERDVARDGVTACFLVGDVMMGLISVVSSVAGAVDRRFLLLML